jgi:hypothetical protein
MFTFVVVVVVVVVVVCTEITEQQLVNFILPKTPQKYCFEEVMRTNE